MSSSHKINFFGGRTQCAAPQMAGEHIKNAGFHLFGRYSRCAEEEDTKVNLRPERASLLFRTARTTQKSLYKRQGWSAMSLVDS
jgi:hypothetical protein